MDYELKECQLRGFYREKMKEMRNNANEQRNKTIEEITEKKVFLSLEVKVEKDWRKKDNILKSFGYKEE